MKKTTFIISTALALLTMVFVACEKGQEPAPSPAATANHLTGTTWLSTYDTTMMYGSLHMENRITFLTDSTGQELSVIEYAFYFDTTYTFTYIFHPDVNGVEVYLDGSHIPSYYRYYPENNILSQGETVFHLVEP